jgi:GT2 family glycosyltransferase
VTAAHRLGVILVNYRSFDDVAATVRSATLAGARVVIVDNASDPAAVDQLCRSVGARPVLHRLNVGFGAAVRAGAESLSDVDEILLLNPDVELRRSDLEQLQDALVSNNLDGVAPLLVEPSGRLQVGAGGGQLSAWAFAVYFLGIAHVFPRLQGTFLTRRQSLRASRVRWLCAACLLIRADAFSRFGGFPTDEVVYGEDVAWGTSASDLGARLALVPGVRVKHRVGGSGEGWRWRGAMERLAVRRLGRLRGWACILILRTGLATRRAVARPGLDEVRR